MKMKRKKMLDIFLRRGCIYTLCDEEVVAMARSLTMIDELMQGAIDLHCHGYPEISRESLRRMEDIESFSQAASMGMRAVVLKSHVWPTTGRSYLLQQQVPDIQIFGSATLNCCSGGVHPWVAELAIREGARLIWMPTWSARYDIERGGFLRYMQKYVSALRNIGIDDGITVLTKEGKLKKDAKDVLALAAESNIPVSTGHLSPIEARALAEEAKGHKNLRLVIGHPINRASRDELKEMAHLGAYIEMTALSIMPPNQRIHPQVMVEVIQEVGAEHCVLTTDAFFEWTPPPAEMMRMLIGSLLALSVEPEKIKQMAQTNPAIILGLDV
jgi:hypothetical protein